MSETVNAAIGYVDDIPMPKVVQHPALFTVAPRVRGLIRKLRRVAYRNAQSRDQWVPT
ncbi:MAG: hypothetical protein U0R81_08240 [Mycobacterium sp.]